MTDPQGKLIDQSTSFSQFTVSVEPAPLKSVQLRNKINQVGQYGPLEVSVKIEDSVEAGGSIEMTFPLWDANGFDDDYVKFDDEMNCKLIDEVININPFSLCFVDRNQNSGSKVLIQNAFSDRVEAGSSVYFVIDGVRNPPSTKPISNISIKTIENNGNLVNYKNDCVYEATQPAEMKAKDIQYQISNEKISSLTDMDLRFKTEMAVPKGSIIRI